MSGIEDFFVHSLSVESFEGVGALGDVYAAPVTVPGFLEGKNVMVRDAAGNMVVASSTFYCSAADGAQFTPDSRVTSASPGTVLPGPATFPGALTPSSYPVRTAYVISQNVSDAPGLDLPEHSAIYLK